MTAHDQLALVTLAAGPARKTRGNDLLCQLIEFGATGFKGILEFCLGLGESLAPDMGVEEIGSLGQYRRRETDGQIEDPVLDLAVFGHQDNKRTFGFEPDELDVPHSQVGFGSEHDAS